MVLVLAHCQLNAIGLSRSGNSISLRLDHFLNGWGPLNFISQAWRSCYVKKNMGYYAYDVWSHLQNRHMSETRPEQALKTSEWKLTGWSCSVS